MLLIAFFTQFFCFFLQISSRYILDISTGIDDLGTIRWQNALCHLLCWVVVYLVTVKGTKVAGKVIYVTATAPYLLLAILLVFTLTLDGSLHGVEYFLIPKWEALLDYNVWLEAALQNMYQGAAAWGSLITMASFNPFKNKIYNDAWIIPSMALFTSIFGGVTIFSTLGVTALRIGIPLEQLAQSSGPGLAFIAYPEALAQMPFSQLWSAIFFLTLITVGIDSQFGLFETTTNGLIDCFDLLRRHPFMTKTISAICCYLLGLPFMTNVCFLRVITSPFCIYQFVKIYSK